MLSPIQLAGDTLSNVISQINTNPNFSASLSGNSIVIGSQRHTNDVHHQFADRRRNRT